MDILTDQLHISGDLLFCFVYRLTEMTPGAHRVHTLYMYMYLYTHEIMDIPKDSQLMLHFFFLDFKTTPGACKIHAPYIFVCVRL